MNSHLYPFMFWHVLSDKFVPISELTGLVVVDRILYSINTNQDSRVITENNKMIFGLSKINLAIESFIPLNVLFLKATLCPADGNSQFYSSNFK